MIWCQNLFCTQIIPSVLLWPCYFLCSVSNFCFSSALVCRQHHLAAPWRLQGESLCPASRPPASSQLTSRGPLSPAPGPSSSPTSWASRRPTPSTRPRTPRPGSSRRRLLTMAMTRRPSLTRVTMTRTSWGRAPAAHQELTLGLRSGLGRWGTRTASPRWGNSGDTGPPSPASSWRSLRRRSLGPTTLTCSPGRSSLWKLGWQRREYRWDSDNVMRDQVIIAWSPLLWDINSPTLALILGQTCDSNCW